MLNWTKIYFLPRHRCVARRYVQCRSIGSGDIYYSPFEMNNILVSEVFEANIRLLGGLLSAHLLMEDVNFAHLSPDWYLGESSFSLSLFHLVPICSLCPWIVNSYFFEMQYWNQLFHVIFEKYVKPTILLSIEEIRQGSIRYLSHATVQMICWAWLTTWLIASCPLSTEPLPVSPSLGSGTKLPPSLLVHLEND